MRAVFGDSISADAIGWVPQLAAALGYPLDNAAPKCVPGAMALDATAAVLSVTPAAADLFLIMFGTNDERIYGNDAVKRGYFRSAVQAHAAWLAAGCKLGALNPGIAYSPGWTDQPLYSGAITVKRSSVQGASAQFQIDGDVLYLWTIGQDVATGTAKIEVQNGGAWELKGNFTTAAPGINTLASQYGVQLVRLAGLGDGLHDVRVTVTSPSSGNNAVYLAGVAGASAGAKVFVSNVIRQTAAGYAANQGSEVSVAGCNVALASALAELAADGLDVQLVDNCAAVEPATMLGPDGCHPADAGRLALKNSWYCAITGGLVYTAVPTYRGSDGAFYIDDGAVRRRISVS